MSFPHLSVEEEHMIWSNSVNLWSSRSLSIQDIEENEENDENRFVMLLCIKRDGEKSIKKWREFKLPLEQHRVEAWAGLCDLRFHTVSTFKDCKQRGINFAKYKYHRVDMEVCIEEEKLENGECYMIVGREDDSIQNLALAKVDDAEEREKSTLARKFRLVTESDEQTAAFYIDSCYNSESSTNILENALVKYYENMKDYRQVRKGGRAILVRNGANLPIDNLMAVISQLREQDAGENTLDDQLFVAAKTGNLEKLMILLSLSIINLTHTDSDGRNVLHIAAEHDKDNVLNLLFTTKRDVFLPLLEIKDKRSGWTPIWYAAAMDSEKCVQVLAAAGADISGRDRECYNLLHRAIQKRSFAAAAQILYLNSDLNKIDLNDTTLDIENATALILACQEGAELIVTRLCQEPHIDFKKRDAIIGYTPLMICAERGFEACVRALLQVDCGINEQTQTGETALMLAARNNKFKVVELLMKTADTNIVDNEGRNALMNALQSQNIAIAKLLASKTQDLNAKYGDSQITALQICAARGYTELVRELLLHGADPDLSAEKTTHDESGGYFPLYNAVMGRHHGTVLELLHKADVNKQTDLLGYSALHLAAEVRDKRSLEYLIKYGKANVNARDAFDRTPLHIANIIGDEDIAKMLVDNGADESARDHMGICAKYASASAPGQIWLLGLGRVRPMVNIRDLKMPVPHSIYNGILYEENRKIPIRIRRLNIKSRQELVNTVKDLIELKQKLPRVTNRIKRLATKNDIVIDLVQKIIGITLRFDSLEVVTPLILDEMDEEREGKEHSFLLTALQGGSLAELTVNQIKAVTLPIKFKIALSLCSTLSILHSQGIVHGNIRATAIQVIKSVYACIIGDYAISCTLDNMKYDRYIAPEIEFRRELSIREATTQRSDVYAAGVFMFEMFFLQKFDPKEPHFYTKSFPDAISDIIYRCLSENENLRPTMKEVYDIICEVQDNYTSQIQKEEAQHNIVQVSRHIQIRERRMTDARLQQFYRIDRNREILHVVFSGTQNTQKAIEKIKSLITLNEQENASLDLLSRVCITSSGSIDDNCFKLVDKLLTQIDEKNVFALLDVLRLLILNQHMFAQLITRHSCIVEKLFSMCTTSTSPNTRLMLLRCLCHMSSTPNGAFYLAKTRLPVVVDFVNKQLTAKDTNIYIQLTATGILVHIREWLTRLNPNTKKLVQILFFTLKTLAKSDPLSKDAQSIEITIERIATVLYSMMKSDENVVEAIKEKDYESLRQIVRNGALVSAMIAMVESIDLDPSKMSREDILNILQ
jgi:ankyrin repeat protein/serine/threonine protein kinase